MISISRFENLDFNSNTYLIKHKLFDNFTYLIDIGNSNDVLENLSPNQKVKGIFLTHAHYDHIRGINQIIEHFPKCRIYCSDYAHKALLSEKLNLSFYQLEPIVLKCGYVNLLHDKMSVKLFENYYIKVLETQGHTKGSLSYYIDEGIFTGDAFIPGHQVVTKLKSGDKNEAKKSVLKIYNSLKSEQKIYPGHGPIFNSLDIDWNFYNSI